MGPKDIGISIVIRCCYDERIFACIESIDEPVELVVATCDNYLADKLADHGVITVSVPRGNLALTSNIGISATTHDKIILVDSDTTFEPGTIARIDRLLDQYDLINIGIRFQWSARFTTQIVAKAREFVNTQDVCFTPGIAFTSVVLNQLGGRLFNNKVPFAVDAEMNYWLSHFDIHYIHDNKSFITHDVESIRHDLRAAYRIGGGCKIGERQITSKLSSAGDHVNLKVVRLSHYPQLVQQQGLVVTLYQVLWDVIFWIGYLLVNQSYPKKIERS